MLAVILCLILVLPRSSHKSPKHDNFSKLLSWKHSHVHTSRQVVIHSTGLQLHNQNHRRHSFCHHHVHHKQLMDGDVAISPFIASACNASHFPDVCQESLVSDPSVLAATSVIAIVDPAGALSIKETLSLRPLAQQLLSASNNVNLTTAAEDCICLLSRATSFLGKSQSIPLAGQVAWQVADAQAWMSAALTHENDCKSSLSYVNTCSAVDNLIFCHHHVHHKQLVNGNLVISPFIASTCNASHFPNVCQESLIYDPSALAATSVVAVVESVGALSLKETLSVCPLAQQLLSASNNVNLTTAAEDCVYLLGRAASFLGKSQSIPLAGQIAWQVANAQAWMSAALIYENDCRSALSYVNTTSAMDNLMRQLGYGITITSNAFSVVDAYRAFGNNASMWVPPTRLIVNTPVQPPSEIASGNTTSRNWWQKPAVRVSLDRSGNYSSVQATVDAPPERATTWYVIHVQTGVYYEAVKIPSTKTRLALIRDGMGKTIINGNRQVFCVRYATVNGDWFEGTTFENNAGSQKHQAVALPVDSDFADFYNCSFLAFQDTLYVHSLQFFKSYQIEGTIDFIFGNAAALFQNCTILFRPGLPKMGTSVVTSQGRTDPAETTAVIFQSCTLNGTIPFSRETPSTHGSCLNRPWKSFSRSVFLKCLMADFSRPKGWLPWNGSFALNTPFTVNTLALDQAVY
ncbi:hypothetical protein L7F22_056890 [Adiantum nelumboides]|nr:hypothetical protein [Adiantum nelumboides]